MKKRFLSVFDLKYLISYLVPVLAFVAVLKGGWSVFWLPLFAFGIIPLVELFLPFDFSNIPPQEEEPRSNNAYFDILLYLHVPLIFLFLHFYLIEVSESGNPAWELFGLWWTAAIVCGVMGINVAHELGHRKTPFERFLSKLLLMCSLYMHFYIEHNRGHHRYVSTPLDPASAPKGMSLYRFWLRSAAGGFLSAWKLEKERLRNLGLKIFSLHNMMIQFVIVQILFLAVVFLLYGTVGGLFFIGTAVGGFLLLETVNYIEHYGLRRKELAPGIFEPVQPHHSWNSEHQLGRIFLYELSRHSDHHYKANRKYQNLRYFPQAPQLSFGYPASMLLSTIPFLWFKLINPIVADLDKEP